MKIVGNKRIICVTEPMLFEAKKQSVFQCFNERKSNISHFMLFLLLANQNSLFI